jgi:HNH endonuclease/NUMOD4 motif
MYIRKNGRRMCIRCSRERALLRTRRLRATDYEGVKRRQREYRKARRDELERRLKEQRTKENTDEVWVSVADYPNYEVSSLGRVWSRTLRRRLLRPTVNRHGYLHCTLSRNNETATFRIHRLVALAFLGKPPSQQHHINHKNGIKTDNRASNLEWATPLENTQHAIRTGLRAFDGEGNPFAKLTASSVREIRLLSNIPGTELAKRYGVCRDTIGKIRSGRLWKNVA